MKQLILIVGLVLSSCLIYAQNVKIDKDGNYHAVQTKTQKAPAINTGRVYTDLKGVQYDVYQSSKGTLFINKISKKTGNTYRYTLKVDSTASK